MIEGLFLGCTFCIAMPSLYRQRDGLVRVRETVGGSILVGHPSQIIHNTPPWMSTDDMPH
jgi:hypothetical protein